MPILMKYGVYHFKLAAPPRCIPSEPKVQPGKDIVVYEFDSREDIPWKIILEQINQQLEEHNIIEGATPCFRCKVNNSLKNEKIILSKEFYGEDVIEYKISKYLYITDDNKDKNYIIENKDKGVTAGPFIGINFLSPIFSRPMLS